MAMHSEYALERMNPATTDSHPRKSAFRNSAAPPIHPSAFIIPPSSTTHSPTPVPILIVPGAQGAKAIS